jgi:hypothetical protein
MGNPSSFAVMAGLVPAIHVFADVYKDVDARHNRRVERRRSSTAMAGHDELK